MEPFLQTKTSYTKIPIRRYRTLRDFSSFINEIWCMGLVLMDKLASQISESNSYWLPLMFFRSFAIQTMKTNYAKHISQAFKKIFLKKALPKSFGLIKEQNMGENFKKICKEKDIESRNETKTAFAERAIQSLKFIIYRYIF